MTPALELLEDRTVPSSIKVTTFADSGPGSLRAAVIASNLDTSSNTVHIYLCAGTYLLTQANISGQENAAATGDLDFTSSAHKVVLRGQGTCGRWPTTIKQTVLDRVFQLVNSGADVTFCDLVITGGTAVDDGTAVPPPAPKQGALISFPGFGPALGGGV